MMGNSEMKQFEVVETKPKRISTRFTIRVDELLKSGAPSLVASLRKSLKKELAA